MPIIHQKFQIDQNICFYCFIFLINEINDEEGVWETELWFNGQDVTQFLEYKHGKKSIETHVTPIDKRSLRELWELDSNRHNECFPTYWQPNAIFISEFGLHDLLKHSKKPMGEIFIDQLIKKLVKNLRRSFQQILIKDVVQKRQELAYQKALEISRRENELVRQQAIEAQQLLVENVEREKMYQQQAAQEIEQHFRRELDNMRQRIANMRRLTVADPKDKDLNHVFEMYALPEKQFAFIRCQRRQRARSLRKLKAQHPTAELIYQVEYNANPFDPIRR